MCNALSPVTEVWFYCYLYDSNFNNLGGEYDYITWGSEEEESIDLLVGEYTETSTSYDMTYDWTSWTAVTDQQSDERGCANHNGISPFLLFSLVSPLRG